jgi:putative MATE family efflux protein
MAAPLAVGHVLHALYTLTDAFWLGKVNRVALAAPGVSMPLMFIAIALGFGFCSAGTALVAQHTGAGRHADASRAAGQTMVLLCGITTCLMIPTVILAPRLLRLLQVPAGVLPVATGYLRIVMMGLIPVSFVMAYGASLRALGDTLTPVIVSLGANVVNMALDPLLIFGWGRVPALGVRGAALATLISQICAATACLFFLGRRRAGLHVTPADVRPDGTVMRKMLSVGLPAAVGHGSTSVGFVIYMAMVNHMGTAAIGAFTVGFRLLGFFRAPTMALAMAAAPIVGQALGAGKPRLARRTVWLSAGLAATIMAVPFGFLTAFGRTVGRTFINDPEVIEEAGRFFLIVPLSSYAFGVLMVLMAAFYGSGHTKPAMAIAIVRVVVLRVPIAYLLGIVAGMGSIGIYAGMGIANILCAALSLWLFLAGGWERAVVPTADDVVTEG